MRLGLLINETDVRAGSTLTHLPRFSVSQYHGVIPSEESSVRSATPKSLQNYKVVEPGDLVLNRFNAYKGALGIAPGKGLVSPDYFTARPVSHGSESYLDYFLRSLPAKEAILFSMSGMGASDPNSSAFSRFDIREVLSMDVPVEGAETQRRIAEHLDTETAQIDTMTAKLDELVELLGERREAVLLSSFFTSDDSSAQALWPMSHLGAHSEVVSRGVAPAYVDENGLRVINQKCVRPGGLIDFSLARQHDLAKKSIKGSLYLQEGDVVVNSTGTGTLGRSALVTELSEPTILDGHVTLVRPNGSSLLGAFLAYFLRAQEQWLVREARGSTNQIELGKDTLLTMPVPLPPLDEQRRIAERLDTVTARIDTMIDKCNELRDLLKERRAALITAVVTGQKEVPHV